MEQNVICGNNIELLKSYPDNHFDAIVTDPPYGLGKEPNAEDMLREWLKSGYMEVKGGGFMGKEWDAFVPQPIFWKEVFRVLKPGGYVLAFYGTRTYDWGVMAMRLAGFEVRDSIQWVYGSGFPKSHNISKAIDKMYGAEREVIGKQNYTMPKADNSMGENSYGISGGKLANGTTAERIVGNITTPATPQAKQWEGWGSALKPAVEPIVVCRKPLEKGLSIAENVLKWGVGGINIDGCRVNTNGEKINIGFSGKILDDNNGWNTNNVIRTDYDDSKGRFPANIILTHHHECECKGFKKVKPLNGSGKASEKGGGFSKGMFGDGKSDNIGGGFVDENGEENVENWNCHPDCPCYIMDRQSGESKSVVRKPNGKPILDIEKGWNNNSMIDKTIRGMNDKGGASRFFYQAKASKSERNRGLEGFANNHPTIKPVKLMQYLVRLVTPPNGLVLDPFCGSGTTGIACRLEGFNFVGMEREEDYAKIAQARIDNWFGASAKESVPESSSLVESASAEDSASARLEPPKEIHTQLKFNF